MNKAWPATSYEEWSETCDTLHAHTQVLGKLAAQLAAPEPQLQHAALRLSARGWETLPLPAPDHSGAVVVALDLRNHEVLVEHSDGRMRGAPLAPDRAVASVTRDLLEMFGDLAGSVEIDPTPQEVPWSVALDQDEEHARYDRDQISAYFAAATKAAIVLAAFRAPFRGRMTPVNAWWGSFDLAVNLFSGRPAEPPAADFIMRNAMDSQEVAVGWWPGDANMEGQPSTPTHTRLPIHLQMELPHRARPAGIPRLVSTSWTGTMSARAMTRRRWRFVRPFGLRSRLLGVSVGPELGGKYRRLTAPDRLSARRPRPGLNPKLGPPSPEEENLGSRTALGAAVLILRIWSGQ